MKQKIKEKVLKKLEKNFPYTTCAIAINETIDLTLAETENKFKGLKGLCDKYRRKYILSNRLLQLQREKTKRVKFYYKDYVSKFEVGKVIDKLVPYHYQRMIDDELESMYVYTEEDIKKLKQKLGIK